MMTNDKQLDNLIREAEVKIRDFDAIDHAGGAATPHDMGWHELLGTAEAALYAAIGSTDWPTAAEAYVFLRDGRKALHNLARHLKS